jgi:hypothetical protein
MRQFIALTLAVAAGTALAQASLPDTPASPAVVEGAKTACVAALRSQMRDPASMQVTRIDRASPPFYTTVGEQQVPVRGYEMVANARNGFGGYTGGRIYLCLTDLAERQVVKLIPM